MIIRYAMPKVPDSLLKWGKMENVCWTAKCKSHYRGLESKYKQMFINLFQDVIDGKSVGNKYGIHTVKGTYNTLEAHLEPNTSVTEDKSKTFKRKGKMITLFRITDNRLEILDVGDHSVLNSK